LKFLLTKARLQSTSQAPIHWRWPGLHTHTRRYSLDIRSAPSSLNSGLTQPIMVQASVRLSVAAFAATAGSTLIFASTAFSVLLYSFMASFTSFIKSLDCFLSRYFSFAFFCSANHALHLFFDRVQPFQPLPSTSFPLLRKTRYELMLLIPMEQ